MIHFEPPENFKSKFEVVSCFLEKDGKFLVLLRQDHKPQGNTWGVPAGKVDPGEKPLEAMAREMREETGFSVESERFNHASTVYVRYPDYDFVYHTFHLPLDSEIEVEVDPKAHKDFTWVTPQESLSFPLIQDLDECVKLFYGIK